MIDEGLQMTEEDFPHLDHFNLKEITDLGEDLSKITYPLLFTLDNLRDIIGVPFVIHCIANGRHVNNSYHYKGIAVDGHFTHPVDANKVVQAALDVGFFGIGMYSWGWHFDLREDCALWKRVGRDYLPLISNNL